ncbi:MAG: hypothetical protein OXU45_04270, partial [Candidatus Melainabacteria bacterium]|nr:hypothetical protein [Candidatus Melainabacteria bacterium]
MQSLDYINPGESGIKSFKPEEFKQKLQQRQQALSQAEEPYALLALFSFGKFSELDQVLQEDPSLVASIEAKALKLLNDCCLGKKPSSKDLFPFQAPELHMRRKIGRKVSKLMLYYYQSISQNLSNFKDYKEWQAIDFWQLAQEIPEMRFVYAQHLLESNQLDSRLAEEIQLISQEEINDTEIRTELEFEQKYLESFYYRRLGDDAKAEQAKLDYFMLYKPDPEQSAEIRSYGNQKFFRAEQVLANWGKVLEEVDQIQQEVELQ